MFQQNPIRVTIVRLLHLFWFLAKRIFRNSSFRSAAWGITLIMFSGMLSMLGEARSSEAPDVRSRFSQIPVRLTAFEGSEPTPVPPNSPNTADSGPSVATSELAGILTRFIVASIPPVYHDERDWNKEREVWDGVHIQLKDGKLITHRKKKLVKAGTWSRYTVRLVEPEKKLNVRFDRLEVTREKGMDFAVTVEADLDLYGQLNEWMRDVRLLSISARADASVRLQVEGTIQLKINPLKLPPDITVVPKVDYAHLDLQSYRLRRISHVGGDTAKLLGKSMKGVVEERLAEENQKLTAKINRKLAQRSHKMTISGKDWLKPGRTASRTNPTQPESAR